ncbi:MAG: hypothetical protein NUW37_16075 [Planctomycetes bacterium]|nr:hypothetical protein [Planctomycetota bacterium]
MRAISITSAIFLAMFASRATALEQIEFETWETAVIEAQEAAGLRMTEDASAFYRHGRTEFQDGRIESAARDFAKCAERVPFHPLFDAALGSSLLLLGEYRKADDALIASLRELSNPLCLTMRLRDYFRSAQVYSEVRESLKNRLPGLDRMHPAQRAAGVFFMLAGDAESAKLVLDEYQLAVWSNFHVEDPFVARCIELADEEFDASQFRGEGFELLRNNHVLISETFLAREATFSPSNPDALLLLSIATLMRERFDVSMKLLVRASILGAVKFPHVLVDTEIRNGLYFRMIDVLPKLKEFAAERVEFSLLEAFAYLLLKDPENAKLRLGIFGPKSPEETTARNFIAEAIERYEHELDSIVPPAEDAEEETAEETQEEPTERIEPAESGSEEPPEEVAEPPAPRTNAADDAVIALSREKFREGRFRESGEILERRLAENFGSVQVKIELARSYFSQGLFKPAGGYVRQSLSSGTKVHRTEAWGTFYFDTRTFDTHFTQLQRHLEREPSDLDSYLLAAYISYVGDDLAESAENLRHIIVMNRNDLEAAYFLDLVAREMSRGG